MATHLKGPGTQNLQVNLLDEERLVFARIAVAEDRSLGDILRRLAVEGLRTMHPAECEQLLTARRSHRQELLNLNL
jgi:hypothetical protein